ncbi:MAG: hypothetical protein IJ220_00325 [Clostridia bacterium]|nr:hypothetical protein [Clostridia bacterium]
MELELNRGINLSVGDSIKNAAATVNEAFNNALDKGVEKLNLENGVLTKVKEGFKNFNIKDVASKTIDTAMKTTLKSVAGIKAKTVDNIKDIGKAIRDSNLKAGLKGVINLGVDSMKGIPTAVKKVIKDGADLILGETFDDELKRVMTTNKNTLSRINTKCDNFEKAFSKNDEKSMKKYVDGISKDLQKISLISETINRGKEIVNRYELMKNKGSTQLTQVEQELLKQLA